ncbi:transketolase C-terminal domain-containing protein [Spirochaetia bacterium 38H-sp]|uniref:Transketolase C-terminal domain-containing protein n=1 Tax=Rarispira pelagica TaxID=3141764 RepID=A0ABU9UAJ2_9SPIR
MRLEKASVPTRRAFSERLVEYGEINKDFVVFESDIGYSTYSYLFGEKYPARYFNFGIAEVSTMAAAAGVATSGRTVVVSGYGVFLTMRALEVVRSFICYPNLNVKILSSHGGVTAAIDGVTHQATEDVAFMSTIPNMKVLAPCDPVSASAMVDLAISTPGPVFTRLMRDALFEVYSDNTGFKIGGSNVLREGSDVTIAAYADMVFQALEAADRLQAQGISAEVIDMYSVKPFDEDSLRLSIEKTGALLVVENHQKRNGLGYMISNWLIKQRKNILFDNIGLDDTFAESGKYQLVIHKYGLDADAIEERTKKLLKDKE